MDEVGSIHEREKQDMLSPAAVEDSKRKVLFWKTTGFRSRNVAKDLQKLFLGHMNTSIDFPVAPEFGHFIPECFAISQLFLDITLWFLSYGNHGPIVRWSIYDDLPYLFEW